MKVAVVDASVAAKWVVDEPGSDAAERLRHCEALHAPAHWLAEACNVVWSKFHKGELSGDQLRTRIMLLREAPVRATAISQLLMPAAEIAMQCRVTIYDALYVSLAVARKAPFVTADRRLCERLRESGAHAQLVVPLDSLGTSAPA